MAHYISYSLFDDMIRKNYYMDNCSNLELIHAKSGWRESVMYLLDRKINSVSAVKVGDS